MKQTIEKLKNILAVLENKEPLGEEAQQNLAAKLAEAIGELEATDPPEPEDGPVIPPVGDGGP